jgi:hypothetical protein
MRKTEMNEEQLRRRSDFVETLTAAGWRSSNFNRNFDEGLSSSPEASMTYSNRHISLRLDLLFEDPRVILYIDSKDGRSLGLVFKCEDRQEPLLEAVIEIKDSISPENIKEKAEELLTACPNMLKISSSGDRLIPVKPRKAK